MRLIDADALKEAFRDREGDDFTAFHFYDAIDNALTVEQPTGEKAEWIYCGVWSEGIGMGQVFGDKVKCSNCMTEYRFTHRFCPYCGRRMKNGKL